MWVTRSMWVCECVPEIHFQVYTRCLLRNVRDCYLQKHAAVCRTRFSNWTHTCTHRGGYTDAEIHRYGDETWRYGYMQSCESCESYKSCQWCHDASDAVVHSIAASSPRREDGCGPQSGLRLPGNHFKLIINGASSSDIKPVEQISSILLLCLRLRLYLRLCLCLPVCIAIDLFFWHGFFNLLQQKQRRLLHDM